MSQILKHTVVGMWIGAMVAVATVMLGAFLLALGFVLALCRWDSVLFLLGGAMGACVECAPTVGVIGFLVGVIGSVIMSRCRRGAVGPRDHATPRSSNTARGPRLT